MTQTAPVEEIQQQAGRVLAQVAGYVGVRAIDIGLRFGLIEEISKHPSGISAADLARQASIDQLYADVWCRAAYASEVLELAGDDRYVLAPHMDKLLLDQDFAGYIGGIPGLLVQPEMFDRFADNLQSGERTWWDKCSDVFIESVGRASGPSYTRLFSAGLSRVPGIEDALGEGKRALVLCCGTGAGLIKMAKAHPDCSLVGLDGDEYSLGLAADNLAAEQLQDRVSLVRSTLEDFSASDEYDVAIINNSMHECRDIEKVTANVHRALRPGGYFVVSDFPFPERTEDCRTVPARVMCGIQFFEAQIDDQLLPTKAFVELLERHGFRNVASFDMTPVHAVTHGQK